MFHAFLTFPTPQYSTKVSSSLNWNSSFQFSKRILLSFVVFSLISGLILYQAIVRFDITVNLLNFPIFLINILIPIFFLSYSLALPNQKMLLALFWMFQLVFFGLTGLLDILDPAPYYLTGIASESDLQKASICTLIAQVFSALAQVWFSRKDEIQPIKFPDQVDEYMQVVRKRLTKLIAIYLFSVPFLISNLGGTSFLLRRTRYGYKGPDLTIATQAVLESMLYVPPVIVLLTYLYFRKNLLRIRGPVILLLLWVAFLSNPLANARQTTIFLVFPILFYALAGRRRVTNVFFSLIPVVLAYNADLVDRFTGKWNPLQFTIFSRDGDFDAFAQFANGIKQADLGSFEYFEQILGPALFFVPRSLWGAKPFDTGVELARQLGLSFQNLSAPWILEAYVNARIPGVIIISILLVFMLSRFDVSSSYNLRTWLVGSVLVGVLFIVLRGSLLQASGRMLFSILIVHYLTRNTGIAKKNS